MALFQIVFHFSHELIRRRSIDDPVVERQAEVAHRPNGDRIIDDDGSFLNRADTQDCDLRLMDDRGAEQAAKSTMIRNRERSSLNLFGAQFLGPRSFCKIHDFFRQLGQSFSIGMPDHRYQQSVIERRGDTDVNIFPDYYSLLSP